MTSQNINIQIHFIDFALVIDAISKHRKRIGKIEKKEIRIHISCNVTINMFAFHCKSLQN